jgi:hypothetical protein
LEHEHPGMDLSLPHLVHLAGTLDLIIRLLIDNSTVRWDIVLAPH